MIHTPASGEATLSGFSDAVARRVAVPAILAAAAVVVLAAFPRDRTERLLRRASVAYAEERFDACRRLADDVLARRPESARAAVLAGWAAARRQRSEEAIAYFESVPEDGSHETREALLGLGERHLRLGRARAAAVHLRKVLETDPRRIEAVRHLAWLLAVQGRSWEARPYHAILVRRGEFRADELALVGHAERLFVDDAGAVNRFAAGAPADPGPLLARARRLVDDNETEAARELVERVVAVRPELAEAQALLGRILLTTDGADACRRWLNTLPDSADRHPATWVVRGRLADERQDARQAIRCYREAVARAPSFTVANYRLSRLLAGTGHDEAARTFAERARRLSTMDYLFSELTGAYDAPLVRRLAVHLESLGRHWEALGWYEMALRMEADDAPRWARTGFVRARRAALANGAAFDRPPAIPAEIEAIAPQPPDSESVPGSAGTTATGVGSHVRFVDVATATGLHFDYDNGTTAETGLEHMLQATGGGVAVIDHDGDGWPDLYFTQAYAWPGRGDRTDDRHRNRLFRNVEGRRFEDVTESAGVGDAGYGQGVAVGDIDNDGDPDLYVCNVGANRLYRNEGDGTFTDVTEEAGVAGDEWSTSAVLADLDGDGLSDLYVVNYLVLDEVLARRCKKDGRPMGCAPTMFTGAQDRLYLNRGNGRFEEVTAECGVEVPGGKGLGVVAFDLDGSGRLSLFVGNDTTANFLFRNDTTVRGKPRFTEVGMPGGVALDDAGLAQASMGVAVDDADGDGRLDLFVTNFYEESNTLYRRLDAVGFADHTRAAGLRDPGFRMLGFGTEFLDADLDGHPDLLVTNGHVDRTFATGAPDNMPPQFLRNLGGGRFAEVPAVGLGEYFSQLYLGRSLAVLDWDRDGRPDACISHLDAPAALLENRTTPHGHHLAVGLEGRRGSRDAFGTRVTVTAGERSWTKQLTAGGGYQVVNERVLRFGLGEADRVDAVRVEWPSGAVDELRDAPVDARLDVVEGSTSASAVP